MTRRKIPATALLLLLLLSLKLNAQVAMSAQVPPAGILQQSQLWNMVVTNASSGNLTATIMLRLMDAVTGQPVLTGTSRAIPLSVGARQLQLKDVGPVSYEYLSPVADRRESALLPPGKYKVCYSIVIAGDKSMRPQTEDCLSFVVEPVAPPQLNTPANAALLDGSQPQFTWIPPAPVNLFSDLNYDLVLVALYENQSPLEAVQVNMPVYRVSSLRQPFMTYPAGAPALDTGITYAWTITANNGRQYAAQTDVWTFRMKRPANIMMDDLTSFVELKRDNSQVINCSQFVKCSYVNDAGDPKATYEIVSLEDKNRVIRHGNINLQPGTNMLVLPLDTGSRLSAGKLYVFRLHNSRSETWEMKFIYSSNQ